MNVGVAHPLIVSPMSLAPHSTKALMNINTLEQLNILSHKLQADEILPKINALINIKYESRNFLIPLV